MDGYQQRALDYKPHFQLVRNLRARIRIRWIFLRWRPEKKPRQCTFEQVRPGVKAARKIPDQSFPPEFAA